MKQKVRREFKLENYLKLLCLDTLRFPYYRSNFAVGNSSRLVLSIIPRPAVGELYLHPFAIFSMYAR